jgi:hypothetical protein
MLIGQLICHHRRAIAFDVVGDGHEVSVPILVGLASLHELPTLRQALPPHQQQEIKLAVEKRVPKLPQFIVGPKHFGVGRYHFATHGRSFQAGSFSNA